MWNISNGTEIKEKSWFEKKILKKYYVHDQSQTPRRNGFYTTSRISDYSFYNVWLYNLCKI